MHHIFRNICSEYVVFHPFRCIFSVVKTWNRVTTDQAKKCCFVLVNLMTVGGRIKTNSIQLLFLLFFLFWFMLKYFIQSFNSQSFFFYFHFNYYFHPTPVRYSTFRMWSIFSNGIFAHRTNTTRTISKWFNLACNF